VGLGGPAYLLEINMVAVARSAYELNVTRAVPILEERDNLRHLGLEQLLVQLLDDRVGADDQRFIEAKEVLALDAGPQ
jgi:hypothetical protein